MAEIELVIKIPEEVYRYTKGYNSSSMLALKEMSMCMNAVANGTPLPKGHGDLVDISPYKGKVICSHLYSGVKKLIEVDSIKPIIKAEGSESE